jgi:hypothetical protein
VKRRFDSDLKSSTVEDLDISDCLIREKFFNYKRCFILVIRYLYHRLEFATLIKILFRRRVSSILLIKGSTK